MFESSRSPKNTLRQKYFQSLGLTELLVSFYGMMSQNDNPVTVKQYFTVIQISSHHSFEVGSVPVR